MRTVTGIWIFLSFLFILSGYGRPTGESASAATPPVIQQDENFTVPEQPNSEPADIVTWADGIRFAGDTSKNEIENWLQNQGF